jgi:4-amino-4-deoxy-L-arabinose transferase-like glycosyltransferase
METTEPEQTPLPSGDKKDYAQKELDQIQSIISRMAGNSFQCKGWAIGIITIVLAIGQDSFLLSGWQSLILLLPVVMFWYLDGFFLYTEQCYRHMFNDVVRRRFQENNWEYLFNYNHTRFEHASVRNQSFWFRHLPVFLKNRFTRLFHQLTGRGQQAPQKITTIVSVMCSKTLLPFYLLPTLFVLFAALKGMGFIKLPEQKKEKEAVVVKVDSSSLVPVLRALEKSTVRSDSTPKK